MAAIQTYDSKFLSDIVSPSYLVGERFGRLTVRKYIRKGSKRNPLSPVWACECDCGQRGVLASSVELRQRVVRSCERCQGPDKRSLRFGVALLHEDGCSIREISRKTGVPSSTVQRWMAGKRDKAA